MAKQYTEEFKKDPVKYWKEHHELGITKCAKNFGIGKSTLSTWSQLYEEKDGSVPTRDRGTYDSDEAKEIALLKKEERDTQDALELLKKAISILEEVLFLETSEMEEEWRESGERWRNVAGVLNILGVSRSGYHN